MQATTIDTRTIETSTKVDLQTFTALNQQAFVLHRKKPEEALKLAMKALRNAQILRDPIQLHTAAVTLGACQLAAERYREARSILEPNLELSQRSHDPHMISHILLLLSEACLHQYDAAAAVRYSEQLMQSSRQLKIPEVWTRTLRLRGQSLLLARQADKALPLLEASHKWAQQLGFDALADYFHSPILADKAIIHAALGRAYQQVGNLSAAQQHLEAALNLYQFVDPKEAAVTSYFLGYNFEKLGDAEAAEATYSDCLDYSSRHPLTNGLGHFGLARLLHKQGRLDESRQSFEQALKHLSSLEVSEYYLSCLWAYANLNLQLRTYQTALESLKLLLATSQQKHYRISPSIHQRFARAYQGLGDQDSAAAHLKLFEQLRQANIN